MARHLFTRGILFIAKWLIVSALSLSPAFATEAELSEHTVALNDVTQGSLLLKTALPGRYIPAPTVKTDVRISVTGVIARATVSQEFMNPTPAKDDWAEGVYEFPLLPVSRAGA